LGNWRLLSFRRAGPIHQSLEDLGFAHGEIGQDLTVQLDAGGCEAADKSAVGQAVRTHGGVDPLNPQGAKIPLSQFAPDIGVLQRAVRSLIGNGDGVLAPVRPGTKFPLP